jgi:hypothetical protein
MDATLLATVITAVVTVFVAFLGYLITYWNTGSLWLRGNV